MMGLEERLKRLENAAGGEPTTVLDVYRVQPDGEHVLDQAGELRTLAEVRARPPERGHARCIVVYESVVKADGQPL